MQPGTSVGERRYKKSATSSRGLSLDDHPRRGPQNPPQADNFEQSLTLWSQKWTAGMCGRSIKNASIGHALRLSCPLPRPSVDQTFSGHSQQSSVDCEPPLGRRRLPNHLRTTASLRPSDANRTAHGAFLRTTDSLEDAPALKGDLTGALLL